MLQNIKRICRPDLVLFFVVSTFTSFFSTGCNTRIEGCLEVNAKNFDLNAENPCNDCCTYPSMGLTLTQKWGDENFTNADTLFDTTGQAYQIIDLRYFMTAWSWTDLSGDVYTVDSVSAGCNSGTLNYTPDVLAIDTRKFSYRLGTVRQAPLIASVHLNLGLVEDFSCLDGDDPATPIDLTEQSPLWNAETSSLETLRLIVKNLDSGLVDTLFINAETDLVLPYSEQMALGIDFAVELTVDYAQWFQDVDVTDLTSFSNSILSHFEGSISRTP